MIIDKADWFIELCGPNGERYARKVLAEVGLLNAVAEEALMRHEARTQDFNESEQRWVAAFREAR